MRTISPSAAIREAVVLPLQSLAGWPAAVGVAALLLFGPAGCEESGSQEHILANIAQDTATPVASQPSRGLRYERERFVYLAKRRDPFLPPDASATVGTLLNQTRILGLIHHGRADLSVVLLGGVRLEANDNGGPAGPQNRIGAVRLRLGQSVGDTRLVEIHPDHVVLEVDTPTGVVRRVLQVPRVSERSSS